MASKPADMALMPSSDASRRLARNLDRSVRPGGRGPAVAKDVAQKGAVADDMTRSQEESARTMSARAAPSDRVFSPCAAGQCKHVTEGSLRLALAVVASVLVSAGHREFLSWSGESPRFARSTRCLQSGVDEEARGLAAGPQRKRVARAGRSPTVGCDAGHHPVMTSSSKTSKTPGVIQAAAITASCSAQVRTWPTRVTVLTSVSTRTSLSSGMSE
jgi:hypothetical protein